MDERTKATAREAGRWGGSLVNFALSAAVGVLPPRWRGGIEARLDLDVPGAAFISGVVQFFLGLFLWMLGMGEWLEGTLKATADAAEAQAGAGKRDDMLFGGYAMLWMNPLMPFIYTFITPVGFLTFLTATGGVIRLVTLAAFRENLADPTLSAVEAGVSALQRRRAVRGRDKQKGEPEPDRHFAGDGKDSDLRILSREDYPWRVGGGIILDGKSCRLVSRAETRDERGRLRVLYDLKVLEGAEVLRGPRVYMPLHPPRIEPGAWPPPRRRAPHPHPMSPSPPA